MTPRHEPRDPAPMRVEIHDSLAAVPAAEWNRLAGTAYPFLTHEFLLAAEQSGSVSRDSGWQPRHAAVRDDAGRLVAAMPLYLKSHSWGEFVFDWAWARAFEQAGLEYYPKLVSATPFTPAASPRLLVDRDAGAAARSALLQGALAYAAESGVSSLHVQFPHADEREPLYAAGLKLRKDCQFHWHNRDYRNFDDFIRRFSSRKRKKVLRDRRQVAEQGIRFRRIRGDEMDAVLWRDVYQLISVTFLRRGSMPYFNEDFFVDVSQRLPGRILVVLAERGHQAIAAAVFFIGQDRLYGRYWGADAHYNALHFETCYYQGIDYCIEHKLSVFEPGTQGEHKVSRGFVPVTTWSAHWLAHDQFFSAVGQYLEDEQRHIDRYMEAVDAHSPYRDPACAAPGNRQ